MKDKVSFIPIHRGRIVFLLSAALVITAAVSVAIVAFIKRSVYEEGRSVVSMVVDHISDDYMDTMGKSESRASVEKSYRNQMSVIDGVVSDMDIVGMSYSQKVRAAGFFHKLCEISDSEELYFVDSTGTMVVSTKKQMVGKDIVGEGILAPEQFSALIYEADRPETESRARIIVEREGGRLIFFSRRLAAGDDADTGVYMLMGCNASVIEDSEAKAIDSYLLMELGYDSSRYMDFAVYSMKDSSFVYMTDGLSDGSHPLDSEPGGIVSKGNGWSELTLGGVEHDCYSRILYEGEQGEILVMGIIHEEHSSVADSRTYSYVYFLAPVFLLLAIFLIIYGYQLERKTRKKSIGKGLFLGLTIVCTALYFIITYFLVSLRQVTEVVYLAENGVRLLNEKTEGIRKRQGEAYEYYKAKDITSTEVIAYSLEYTGRKLVMPDESYPYYRQNDEGDYVPVKDAFGHDLTCCPEAPLLQDRKSVMDASGMWLINEKGYAIASSSDRWHVCLGDMPDGEELRRVMFLEEKSSYKYLYDDKGNAVGTRIAYPVNIYACSEGGRTRYASYNDYLASRDGASDRDVRKFRGLLLIEMDGVPKADQVLNMYVNETMNSLLNDVGCSYIRISDPDERGYVDRKVRMCDGMDVDLSGINVPAKMEQDRFNFIREISKRKYFIHMERDNANSRYVALVFDNSRYVHYERMRGVGYETLCSMIGFFILMLLVVGTRGANDYMNPGYSTRLVSTGESRGVVLLRRFIAKKPEEKLMMALQAVLVLFVTFIIVLFASKTSGGQERFFTDIYSQEFERAVNFYNISAALGVLIAIIICFSLIKKVIDIICDPLGEKFETYATLTVTIFQCLLLFCGLFYGAYLLGMELKSIGTMATVVAGAIGLGSKEIIADITAGIQIVTGGKVVLGDLICVEGFTGVVKEMRLRCCMLENKEGMIKSVPNSKMISVVVIERGRK